MMEADFDEADTELLADIIGRLGLADVAAVTQPEARPGFNSVCAGRTVKNSCGDSATVRP
jgi:hypothetical protein